MWVTMAPALVQTSHYRFICGKIWLNFGRVWYLHRIVAQPKKTVANTIKRKL
jgi:hypothetical protein